MIENAPNCLSQTDSTRASAASGKAGARNTRDKHRAAAPFSFVHFFWATQKKWTNGFKRCGAPFVFCMTPCKNQVKGVERPLKLLHDPCETGFEGAKHLWVSARTAGEKIS